MRKILFALALLLTPGLAHAQCAISNLSVLPLGPFTGYSDTIHAGDETFYSYDISNTNPNGCAAETFCMTAFIYSATPGEPTPNGILVHPLPSAPACVSLSPGQAALLVTHYETSIGATTPPFYYQTVLWTKVNGALQRTTVEFLNVLDPWGNTCRH